MARRYRRRRRKPDDSRFTDAHRLELLTGMDLFDEGFRADEKARRAAWFAHRDQLLAFWLQDPETVNSTPAPGGPGTRPWAWWRYEAPGLRRELGNAPLKPCPVSGESFGIPLGYRHPGYDPDDPPIYETEAAYLARHGLLTADERAQLAKDDRRRADVVPLRSRRKK